MFRDFFRGRYGIDNLGYALFFLALIILRNKYLSVVGAIILGYAIYRIISKDINKRKKELQKFNVIVNRIRPYFTSIFSVFKRYYIVLKKKFDSYKIRYNQRMSYVFVTCSKCKKILRLPKNKGKLSVTCPICKNQFVKKT